MARRIDYTRARRSQLTRMVFDVPSGPKVLKGSPTKAQLAYLRRLGVEETPDDRAMASRWITAALRGEG